MILLCNSEGMAAMEPSAQRLQENRAALDVVEEAIRIAEAEPGILTVGKGGYPNLLGDVD